MKLPSISIHQILKDWILVVFRCYSWSRLKQQSSTIPIHRIISFSSILVFTVPVRFIAGETQTDDHAAVMKLDRFPLFLDLPAELRYMIIEEALMEEEHERVVLLDRQTHRVFPTKELAAMASPFLYVSKEFRWLALKAYTKVDVFDLGAPKAEQYGNESNWYMLPESFEYLNIDPAIHQQIHKEATNQGVHKGCLYVDPAKDTFLVGICPRLVAQSTPFSAITKGSIGPWDHPRDLVTAPLSQSVRAKTTTMREVEWDIGERCLRCGKCYVCGRAGFPCCTGGFYYDRGENSVPFWLAYANVNTESCGFYLLVAGEDMQKFFHDFTNLGGKACLKKWSGSYLKFHMDWLKDDYHDF